MPTTDPLEEKKQKKPEPSPYREWQATDKNDRVPWLRVGYFDGWCQVWVVEGLVRSPATGRISKDWKPVGQLSDRTEWFWDQLGSRHFTNRVGDLRREIENYKNRSKEWLDKGGSLRDLNLAMAKANGTWKEEAHE